MIAGLLRKNEDDGEADTSEREKAGAASALKAGLKKRMGSKPQLLKKRSSMRMGQPRAKPSGVQFNEAAAAGGRTAKVLPLDSHADGDADHDGGQSVMSKSSNQGYHAAINNSKSREESSLVLLRRLLVIVTVAVVGLSLVTMTMSKSIVSDSDDAARLTSLDGNRLAAYKVSCS